MPIDIALQQPGNEHPRSRAQNARLKVVDIVRRLRPTSSGAPSSSSLGLGDRQPFRERPTANPREAAYFKTARRCMVHE
jgi:hypothetical protein